MRYLSKVLSSILLHLCATALTLMLVLFKVAQLLATSCCDLCDYPHLENTPGGFVFVFLSLSLI